MSIPITTNGLMRHLRNNCDIQINGSYQKKQLISYGYYHGYKGYRFFKKSSSRIPFSNFDEIVAVIEYDNNLKAELYPALMFIETATKNIVCNEALNGLKNSSFEHVYQNRMNDNLSNSKNQSKRLQLRNSIYQQIKKKYDREGKKSNRMIRHFYDRGEDIPLWAIFEIIYLSDLAIFFEGLNFTVREHILQSLNMLDIPADTDRKLLSILLYTLKVLRNEVAHNGIIFDARFKDRNISPVLKTCIENEIGIHNINLYALIDYIIITCYTLKHLDFNDDRAKKLLYKYKAEKENLEKRVSNDVYSYIFQRNELQKINALENYLN